MEPRIQYAKTKDGVNVLDGEAVAMFVSIEDFLKCFDVVNRRALPPEADGWPQAGS